MRDTDQSLLLRMLREPLTHFLVLGAALFLLYSHVGDATDEQPDHIMIDATQIQVLADQFQRTWMRPPTRDELQGLTEDFIKEEILYREALALGLDQNDLIIRRRMRQKMEFLTADLVEQQQVTDAELQTYLEANAERFTEPPRVSFQQVFFRTENGGQERISAALQQLTTNPASEPQTLGDATLLPATLADASTREISRSFGSTLTDAMADAPLDRWSGPYPSAYGLHLVRVTKRTPRKLPALDEIRDAVEREWSAERSREARERFYQALRSRYSIEIKYPADATTDSISLQTP